jgi:murein DD-endopeptidase MepM/ murein hydrolase activator NlpD
MRYLLRRKRPSDKLVIHCVSIFALIQVFSIGLSKVALDQTRQDLCQLVLQPEGRVSCTETDGAEQEARSDQRKASLEEPAEGLQQMSTDRDAALGESHRLMVQIGELGQKHSDSEILWSQASTAVLTSEADLSQPDTSYPKALITVAPPEPERDPGASTEPGHVDAGHFVRVLASIGLNIQRLSSQFNLNRAEGGPFVPPPKSDRSKEFDSDELERIRGLIKSLPLSAPLEYFRLESRFGSRRDPFNRRRSFHTGLDLVAPFSSPIFATARGIVTYAGNRHDYGKVVEIDHGSGISTIYGHMHRYTVSVGQRVVEHTQIGLLGSTGRSTGPHVHYEVLVNGPKDLSGLPA